MSGCARVFVDPAAEDGLAVDPFEVTVPPLLEKAAAAAERAGVEEIFVYGEAVGATPDCAATAP